ncbi:trypsin-like peptidase domain-containing protein [Luteolibacter sp. AS25]|uniref:trypsin-like peptidase domain-containing protein n=1 Tax=Luteolibacter sp. AS25 TaxID=3135776 RepID=UPI00398A58A1
MSAIKRFFALLLVFALFFLLVTGIRTWQAGGDLMSLLPDFLQQKEENRPEAFTAADSSALDLSEVEILSRINQEYARLTQAVVPSVVSINTAGVRTEKLMNIWGQSRIRQSPTTGLGSGVIVSKEGHIITNHHVIAGQQQIRVTLHSGKTYNATLIGEDPLLDIAVIKIDSKLTFTPLKLGDSSEVEVGQIVFAVGNPFGLGETVTQGIISAKERSLTDSQGDLFQTDAAINPGNSGGPLVNLTGEIIGINAAIISADKEKPGFQGVGFSIPSNEVREALDQIIRIGRPIRGYLGVHMRDLDATIRNQLDYHEEKGTLVLGVAPGGPAEKAGLVPKDVVRTFDGTPIENTRQLINLVLNSDIDQKVSMEVWREGEIITLDTTISETTAAPKYQEIAPEQPKQDNLEILKQVGVEVRDLTTSEKNNGYRGVVVQKILSDGKAAGILEIGDLIIALNNSQLNSSAEFYLHLAASAAVQATSLQIVREGEPLRLNLPPPEK